MKKWIDEKVEYLYSRISRVPQKDFLFEPNNEFYEILERVDLIPPYDKLVEYIDQDKLPYVTFSAATESIAKHLGRDVPQIEFHPIEGNINGRHIAGQIQIGNQSEKIQIASHFKEKALQLGRILAHEISHDFLHSRGIMLSDTEENERLTDLASLVLGLGKLVLNGMEKRTGVNVLRLGYLSPPDLAYAYVKVNSLFEVPLDTQLTNLTYTAHNLVKPLLDEINVKKARSLLCGIREQILGVQNRMNRFKMAYDQIRDNQELINSNVASFDIAPDDGRLFVNLNSYSFQLDSEGFTRQSELALNEIRNCLSDIERTSMTIDQILATIKSLEHLDARIGKLDKESERSWDKLIGALCVQEKYLNQRSSLVIDRFQELIREQNIEKALRLAGKGDCGLLNKLGIDYAKNKDPLALEIFDTVIKLDPHDALGYYNRGNMFRDLNQYNSAMDDYTKALEFNPAYVNAYINRGNVYFRLQRYPEAIANYNKALELRSSYRAYVNRGNAYLHLNRFLEAIEDFQIALKLNTVDLDNKAREEIIKAFSLIRAKGGVPLYAKIRLTISMRHAINSIKRSRNRKGQRKS